MAHLHLGAAVDIVVSLSPRPVGVGWGQAVDCHCDATVTAGIGNVNSVLLGSCGEIYSGIKSGDDRIQFNPIGDARAPTWTPRPSRLLMKTSYKVVCACSLRRRQFFDGNLVSLRGIV